MSLDQMRDANKSFDRETNKKYNKSEKSIKDFSKPNSCFEEKKINFATSENLKERIFLCVEL